MGLIFNAVGANEFMQLPFYYHFLWGVIFGAVFMATDPVTAAQTEKANSVWPPYRNDNDTGV